MALALDVITREDNCPEYTKAAVKSIEIIMDRDQSEPVEAWGSFSLHYNLISPQYTVELGAVRYNFSGQAL
jgi:hypothetical protein